MKDLLKVHSAGQTCWRSVATKSPHPPPLPPLTRAPWASAASPAHKIQVHALGVAALQLIHVPGGCPGPHSGHSRTQAQAHLGALASLSPGPPAVSRNPKARSGSYALLTRRFPPGLCELRCSDLEEWSKFPLSVSPASSLRQPSPGSTPSFPLFSFRTLPMHHPLP